MRAAVISRKTGARGENEKLVGRLSPSLQRAADPLALGKQPHFVSLSEIC